jgi:predicted dinucleotide-utilizing enzyme
MQPFSFAPQNLSQAINPWSLWMQPGLINVNMMATREPDTELRMVRDGASYGSQLGRITELLETVVEKLKLEGDRSLNDTQRKTVADFLVLAAKMKAVKDQSPSGVHKRVDVLVDELSALSRTDPLHYAQLHAKLIQSLPEAPARARKVTARPGAA